MKKNKNEYVTQVALFKSKSRETLETALNGSLKQIATLGYRYSNIKIWSDDGSWYGILEYEMGIEELTGGILDDSKERIKRLKDFRYNKNGNISDIGLSGCQALIVQNNIPIDIDQDYNDIKRLICEKTNLTPFSQVGDISIEVEVVDIDLGIDEK